jgi:hypothetical protein
MSLQSEPTTSQLRRDIDRGRAGDKVDHPDPAAAPLGTDEEAAGVPVPPSAIADAHREEVAAGPDAAAEAVRRTGSPMVLSVLAILAVAVVVLVVWSVFT